MNVTVVLVTYNRLKDLRGTLQAYEGQTCPPREVIVVDNHSTDGTVDFLREWEGEQGAFRRTVCLLPENIGGSGGFAHGMTEALKTDCDWVFVADDDAVPHADMLEKLAAFAEKEPALTAGAAALCTAVNNRGRHTGVHRCRLYKTPIGNLEITASEKDFEKEYFFIDFYSFVGTLIRKTALAQAGVARADFFIYNDDYEHALRVGRYGKLICVPAAVMDHVDNLQPQFEATWRDYYGTRNAVIMHREHFGRYAAFWRAARRLAMGVKSGNPKKVRVIWDAIRDAYAGKTGLHPVYKPGWKAQ